MAGGERPYHKGNLRGKLLQEAARIVARDGAEGLSMRKLGERLGISRMAAYHHFEDKDALLAAIGREGFGRLAAKLEAVGATDSPALDRLRAALHAYVSFATEERAFFRLMFADVLERPLNAPAPRAFGFSSREALAAFESLLSLVARAQREGRLRRADPLVAANMLWAFSHGVACLAINEHLKLAVPGRGFPRPQLRSDALGVEAPPLAPGSTCDRDARVARAAERPRRRRARDAADARLRRRLRRGFPSL